MRWPFCQPHGDMIPSAFLRRGTFHLLTPRRTCPDRPRGDEMRAWLARSSEVTRSAVLDDENDGLDGLPLFRPMRSQGLTSEMAAGIVAYLTGQSEADMRH